jgi:tRNA pseudouridine55 synthase
MDGVVVIAKPAGITSHDVVARVRKKLGVRRAGHAGTLDPMATGVLVVMVGEATKLAPWLTAEDKSYRATVRLGVGTDTLDAEGVVTAEAPLPAWWHDPDEAAARIEAALTAERARTTQLPPAHSALKVGGVAAYKLARAGAEVELSPRAVAVRRLALVARDPAGATLALELDVQKGYYVRALARDLGQALDVPAHLVALCRSASGRFVLADATAIEDVAPHRLTSIADAARQALPSAVLTPDGVLRARRGALLEPSHFAVAAAGDGPTAWLDAAGRLVAVGRADGARAAVIRVFSEH